MISPSSRLPLTFPMALCTSLLLSLSLSLSLRFYVFVFRERGREGEREEEETGPNCIFVSLYLLIQLFKYRGVEPFSDLSWKLWCSANNCGMTQTVPGLHHDQTIKKKDMPLTCRHHAPEILFSTTIPTLCTNSTAQYSQASTLWKEVWSDPK